jgi:hypothetical protein
MDLRRPETSRNCKSVCDICGTGGDDGGADSSGCSSFWEGSGGGGGGGGVGSSGVPSLSTEGPVTISSRWSVVELPGSTRVKDVRVLAGSAAISTGIDLENVGSEGSDCDGGGGDGGTSRWGCWSINSGG